jgi:hypothetical protein
MYMNSITRFTFVFLLAQNIVLGANNTGLEVAKLLEKSANGFIGESSTTNLIIISASKEKITRKMDNIVLEVPGDGDRSLSTFLTPLDVRGTKLLSWGHDDKEDKQWLYLPSIKRVKRISSNNRSSSFMGSEFTYEDLTSQELSEFTYDLLDETPNEWTLKKTPQKKSGYKFQIHKISKKYQQATMIEYYDRKGELIKVANSTDFSPYKVKNLTFWRPGKIHIKNTQTKRESILTWDQRVVGKKISKRLLTKKTLK